mmetsp:Transcript_5355/g.15825  ORF Transcript_5355/g.15825 Transcript_5355/m.15825 type:complete len:499 (-) Transcript_5355:179-1675(-)
MPASLRPTNVASQPIRADTAATTVAASCPAFADGCPYASNDRVMEWIKMKRSDAITLCPAFKEGCPFHEVRDLGALRSELQRLPPSHAGGPGEGEGEASPAHPAHAALVGMLQAVHQASQSVKESVGGDCPVFQQECPFKNCLTSAGTPLVVELETRTWGLMIHAADSEPNESEGNLAGAPPSQKPDRGLAEKLKTGTQAAHKAAETVHFVHEFIKGKVPRELYAQLIINLFHVYQALEEALDACADHPLVDPIHFPDELRRAPSLRADAEYFHGSGWEQRTEPSQVTREYVERLRQVGRESPELIVPHAYTRYLGDLSGGKVLKRAAVRGLGLPEDGSGVNFYTFKRISDGKTFKNMYRARLDSLSADKATADSMVVEANAAFNFNTRIFQELDVLGGYEGAPTPAPQAPALAPAAGRGSVCPFAALAATGAAMPPGHPAVHPEVRPTTIGVARPLAPAAHDSKFSAVARPVVLRWAVALAFVLVAWLCALLIHRFN